MGATPEHQEGLFRVGHIGADSSVSNGSAGAPSISLVVRETPLRIPGRKVKKDSSRRRRIDGSWEVTVPCADKSSGQSDPRVTFRGGSIEAGQS